MNPAFGQRRVGLSFLQQKVNLSKDTLPDGNSMVSSSKISSAYVGVSEERAKECILCSDKVDMIRIFFSE